MEIKMTLSKEASELLDKVLADVEEEKRRIREEGLCPLPFRQYAFDVDGTLTRSRSVISKSLTHMLQKLIEYNARVIILSGAEINTLRRQLPFLQSTMCYVLPESGTQCYLGENILWKRHLSGRLRRCIEEHIRELRESFPELVSKDRNDLIEYRTGMISFSFIGYSAPLEEKEAFDPTGARRKEVLASLQRRLSPDISAFVAGTSSISYMEKGFDKGSALSRLLSVSDWARAETVYFADQFGEWGNDEPVREFVPNIYDVTGPDEVAAILLGHFLGAT